MPIINFKDLRDVLESSFEKEREYLKSINKFCTDEESFLCNTYRISQSSITGSDATYNVIIFEDLPEPYPVLINERISNYLNEKKITFYPILFSSYLNY